jgi:hypothetical protein
MFMFDQMLAVIVLNRIDEIRNWFQALGVMLHQKDDKTAGDHPSFLPSMKE